jgi:hypothetical protein
MQYQMCAAGSKAVIEAIVTIWMNLSSAQPAFLSVRA